MPDQTIVVFLFIAAILYTAVGHAGASGYLAVMAFYSVAPETMRPTALILNIIAAIPTVWRFTSAGHFDRRLFLLLASGSIPFALLGSPFQLPYPIFRWLIASALAIAAIRLIMPGSNDQVRREMPAWAVPCIGAPIGLLAGLTGIGGGVYLTPILLFAGLATTKKAAGVSASFILVNSVAGLIGQWRSLDRLTEETPWWGFAVLIGGFFGSTLGSRMIGVRWLRYLLAVVLLLAIIKLL